MRNNFKQDELVALLVDPKQAFIDIVSVRDYQEARYAWGRAHQKRVMSREDGQYEELIDEAYGGVYLVGVMPYRDALAVQAVINPAVHYLQNSIWAQTDAVKAKYKRANKELGRWIHGLYQHTPDDKFEVILDQASGKIFTEVVDQEWVEVKKIRNHISTIKLTEEQAHYNTKEVAQDQIGQ